jgi:hypothetical protein
MAGSPESNQPTLAPVDAAGQFRARRNVSLCWVCIGGEGRGEPHRFLCFARRRGVAELVAAIIRDAGRAPFHQVADFGRADFMRSASCPWAFKPDNRVV